MKSGIIKSILTSYICVLIWYIPIVYGNLVIIYDYTNYEAISFIIGVLINLMIFTILIELGFLYIYFRKYIVDIKRPLTPASHTHISGWVYYMQQVHKKDLMGVEYNVLETFDISSWYYEVYG